MDFSSILEWVASPFSRESSQPRNQTWVSCIADRFFTIWATKETLINRSHILHDALLITKLFHMYSFLEASLQISELLSPVYDGDKQGWQKLGDLPKWLRAADFQIWAHLLVLQWCLQNTNINQKGDVCRSLDQEFHSELNSYPSQKDMWVLLC